MQNLTVISSFHKYISQNALVIGKTMHKPGFCYCPSLIEGFLYEFDKHGIFVRIFYHPSLVEAKSIPPLDWRLSYLFPHGHSNCWSASLKTIYHATSFAEWTIYLPWTNISFGLDYLTGFASLSAWSKLRHFHKAISTVRNLKFDRNSHKQGSMMTWSIYYSTTYSRFMNNNITEPLKINRISR